jgi:hypothetical protein
MGFADAYIRGHQAGTQLKKQREDAELEKMMIEHKLRGMKIDEAIQRRQIEKQNFDLIHGQPANTIPSDVTSMGTVPTGTGFSVPVPNVQPKAMTIHGVPELGIGDTSIRPQSQEAMSSAAAAAKLREMMTSTHVLGQGGQLVTGTGQLLADNPSEPKPTMPAGGQLREGIVDGVKGAVIFHPDTGKMINARTGKETTDFHAPDAANQQDIEDVKLTKNQERTAIDLSSGDLTFDQFTRLYPSRGNAGAGTKAAIYARARELNPAFNPAQFEIGYKFAVSPKIKQQIASINNVTSGVDDLLKFSDAAQRQGANILNSAILKGGVAFGGKAYNDFKTARIAFADELSGALGYGSATDMAKQMGLDLTDPTMSPANFRSAIENVVVPFVARKKASIVGEMGPYKPNEAPQEELPPAALFIGKPPGDYPATSPSGKQITVHWDGKTVR